MSDLTLDTACEKGMSPLHFVDEESEDKRRQNTSQPHTDGSDKTNSSSLMTESKAAATETSDLWSSVYSPAENDARDHKMAVSYVPGTALKALRSHVPFTLYHNSG